MMDEFTQRMLARAQSRQKKLGSTCATEIETHKSEPNITRTRDDIDKEYRKGIVSEPSPRESPNRKSLKSSLPGSPNSSKASLTRVTSEMPGSPKPTEKTLNIQRDAFNMEIKVTAADDVRVQVEIEERDASDNESIDGNEIKVIGGLRVDAKQRLQRLGKLYSGIDEVPLSSPIHKTEEKFHESIENASQDNSETRPKESKSRLRRLADLADTINQWEDDSSHASTKKDTKQDVVPKKSWKPPAPKPPVDTKKLTSKNEGDREPKQAVVSVKKENTKPENPNIKRVTKGPAPKPPIDETPPKPLKWDKKVLDSLESQGYTRTESTARLVYNYKQPENPEPEIKTSKLEIDLKPEKCSPVKPKLSPTKNIMSMAAKFESSATSPASKKDPALLPLSERKALFEKNKGEALVPKAAFAMAVPAPKDKKENMRPAKPVSKVDFEPTVKPTTTASESSNIANKLQALLKKANTISETQILQSQQQERQRELEMLKNRFVKNKEISEKIEEPLSDYSSDEEQEGVTERTKMLPDASKPKVVTFKDNAKESVIPTAPPLPDSDSKHKRPSMETTPKVKAILDDVKRVKISPQKEGRLYPCLSDIEATTETDNGASSSDENPPGENSYTSQESDTADTSFGREIMRAVCRNRNDTSQKRHSTDSSDLSGVLNDMDEYLDDQDDSSAGPTPPKYRRRSSSSKNKAAETSYSFRYKNYTPEKENYTSPSKGSKTPGKEGNLPEFVIDEGTPVPLMHTVSFYRRQQSQPAKTPLRQIQRPATLIESPSNEDTYASDSDAEEYMVEEKIRHLQDEVNKQQIVISQASQALNLCCSTIEFSGSSEQVEAERLLLVATHRRQSALLEIQRLKIERTLRPGGGVNADKVDKGTLTISDIVLPLKRDYVRALTTAGGLGHHLMCLVRYAEKVIPTPIVATGNPPKPPQLCVRIPGSIKLDHVYADFTVKLEIYSMHAHEEILPHEVKYHIGKKNTKLITPKKGKAESKLVKPPIQSPAGPNAVRTTSFTTIGYVVFSIREIARNQWTLNKVPIASPLDGTVQMKIDCELAISAEMRGFLTMFEDVSGFGAWHRRWCQLKGHLLNYWKYPDDEKKKAPIGTIDLRGCVTQNVSIVSRDICARPNTFLLEFTRPRQSGDTNTLVTVLNGETTTLRHLLSADTKEERVQWCLMLNKSLSAIKSWGGSSH